MTGGRVDRLGLARGRAVAQAVTGGAEVRRTMASPIRLTSMIEKDVGHDRAVLARRRRCHAPAAGPAWTVPPLAPALRTFGGAARRWVSSSSPRQTAIRRSARAEWQLTRAMRERISIRRRRDAEWQFGCGRPPRSSRTPRRLPRTSRLRQRRLGRGRPEGVSLAQGSRFGGHALYSGSRRRPRC